MSEPRNFGGLGGVRGGRGVNSDDLFEAAVDRALGAKMRADDEVCREVWCALANNEWTHRNGDTAGYTWRAAGDLVAAVSGKGDYMRWYMSGPAGEISERCALAMGRQGWNGEAIML